MTKVQKIVNDVQAKAPENVGVKCHSYNRIDINLSCYDRKNGEHVSTKVSRFNMTELYEWANSDRCQRNEKHKLYNKPLSFSYKTTL